jgi:hypothetical protein
MTDRPTRMYTFAMPRGRRPIPTAIHLARGTFRKSRHGDRIDAPRPGDAHTTPIELSEAEQAKRRAELDAQRRAIYGENPPEPEPRSGGSARRIRW